MQYDLKITTDTLEVASCVQWVMAPECGGIDIFVGTVRNATKGREVVRLEFEAYEPMALSELQKIVEMAAQRWPVFRILVHHRTGILQVGDIPVVIAVSAAHRDAAFDACRYVIDTLKEAVPIWKKEVFEDGSHWVAAHP